jgi:Rrf2 family transcriptional regulator, nitric oxide-sensitive transcriptional repressor
MLFSQTVEYALRSMVWLADHPDEAQVTQQIADATKVPAGYLSKVLQGLGRAGLVKAQRGLGGGWTLTRPPDEISILDVVNAVDPIQRITTCPLGLKSHGKVLCPLHKKLDDAMEGIEDAFRTSSLADMLKPTSKSRPLCEVTVKGMSV